MTIRVSCPFCNSGFELPVTAPGRIPCPRCGESFAVQPPTDGVPQPSLNGDGVREPAVVVDAPAPAKSGLQPLALLASALLAAAAVGIGVWLSGFFQKPDPRPVPTRPETPGATWPPQTLQGLRYLPADSKVVFALQPGPLMQYAKRTEKDPNRVLADGGMPKQITDWLNEAGLAPEQIDHVAVGVKLEGLVPPFAILLALRKPLEDEPRFFDRMKARWNADKKLHTVNLKALIAEVSVVKVDETKYLFALRDEDLALAKKPADGITHFRQEMQESLRKLSPAAFLWLATDGEDWKANKTLEFLATVGMGQEEYWKKLDPKLRNVAIGLVSETELTVRTSVRYVDVISADARGKDWTAPLAAAQGESNVEGQSRWVSASVPLYPTDACGKMLKLIFTP